MLFKCSFSARGFYLIAFPYDFFADSHTFSCRVADWSSLGCRRGFLALQRAWHRPLLQRKRTLHPIAYTLMTC